MSNNVVSWCEISILFSDENQLHLLFILSKYIKILTSLLHLMKGSSSIFYIRYLFQYG